MIEGCMGTETMPFI